MLSWLLSKLDELGFVPLDREREREREEWTMVVPLSTFAAATSKPKATGASRRQL